MARDAGGHSTEAPTRRETIKGGGALVGGGLLAGCAGESGPGGEANGSNNSSGGNATTASGENSYEVCMRGADCIQLDEVPTRYVNTTPNMRGMGIALGQGDGLIGSVVEGDIYVDGFFEKFHQRFDSSFSLDGVTRTGWIPNKEVLYELDPGVMFTAPELLLNHGNWSENEIKEIEGNVAPFFADHAAQRPFEFEIDYEPLDLWETFEKVAEVFKQRERFEALAAVRNELLRDIQTRVPDDTPEVAWVGLLEDGFYSPLPHLSGHERQSFRDIGGVENALSVTSRSDRIDMEGMLEADPDYILLYAGYSRTNIGEDIRTIRNDPVGSELSAVQNDRLYRSVDGAAGPLQNLVDVEMLAKQLYPDDFGEWPDESPEVGYPEIPEDEQLFDRQRVADIVNGDF